MCRNRIAATGLFLLMATVPIAPAQDKKPVPAITLSEQAQLETFKAQHLAERLEALSEERVTITQKGHQRDNLVLSAADDRTWATRMKWLRESVLSAQEASDAWDNDVLPLETNEVGKTLARHDSLTMAYIVQVERADLARLRGLLKESNRILSGIDAIRGDSHRGGISLVDDLTGRIKEATSVCNAARKQIGRYVTKANSALISGESTGPMPNAPNLETAAATLKNEQLHQGLKELQSRKIRIEYLKQHDHDRLSRVMSGELAVLYKTASYLRSLPAMIEGRLGYSAPMVLQFTSRIGCEFRAKVHFCDRHGKYLTSVWADGFCNDERFRFETVSWVNGPPKGSSFSLGYVYEGTIGAKQISGRFSPKNSTKSAGDFSFNTTKAFVFSSDNSIVEAGEN